MHVQDIYQAEVAERIFPTALFEEPEDEELDLPKPDFVQVNSHPVLLIILAALTVCVAMLLCACICVLYYWRKQVTPVANS